MNEEEFRKARLDYDSSQCPFEKVILTGEYSCNVAKIYNLGERQGLTCSKPNALEQCQALIQCALEQSHFALGMTSSQTPLPHAKALRLQQSCLQVLADDLENKSCKRDDIHKLLDSAIIKWVSIESLPYEDILRRISHTQRRKNKPAS